MLCTARARQQCSSSGNRSTSPQRWQHRHVLCLLSSARLPAHLHAAVGEHTLLHGEALLVLATHDLEDVALELLRTGSGSSRRGSGEMAGGRRGVMV